MTSNTIFNLWQKTVIIGSLVPALALWTSDLGQHIRLILFVYLISLIISAILSLPTLLTLSYLNKNLVKNNRPLKETQFALLITHTSCSVTTFVLLHLIFHFDYRMSLLLFLSYGGVGTIAYLITFRRLKLKASSNSE